ncbi:hypothetical protein [Pendulispora albinea]|uniref:Uncharacterized protein n=1 Tax=Pendulispora albinea TaxID=2741071 RepID=A0ABZ2LRV2_9BACT
MSDKFSRLIFEYGFDDRDEYETPLRGYRSHVWVELIDGSKHRVTFFDTIRLQQELQQEMANGRGFFAEPGLIVLNEVTREAMEAAARTLANEGFFDGAV